ncbi:Methyltransferase type 12 [Nitrobacter hamburgensis X14]|uniref:Methyltransferase type 12 n=1 Tax=Nitrobacter hamburgensis (strain DSM 10229 / NCIMB 13809 / X14) TaxID=323097 RepID=Q1QKT7_NITHX|nr:class I SAM-dependent methyltransferase [Nitrobacter hamburgensis]ABE63160.1 Methyltransferase type 12 [Nitrobacter hamburgensis X14]
MRQLFSDIRERVFHTRRIVNYLSSIEESLRTRDASVVEAPPPAAPVVEVSQTGPAMKALSSLKEFDDYCESLKDIAETDRIPLLCNCYLADDSFIHIQADPFSQAYANKIMAIHAEISGRSSYSELFEYTPVNIDDRVARPGIYLHDGNFLAGYLESFGQLIRTLDVRPGTRVLEYGCGDAQISLLLARLGCDVTVIDIDPNSIKIVQQQAARIGCPITAIVGNFLSGEGLQPFDRIFFYQAFHHSIQHVAALKHCLPLLNPEGMLLFGCEPVIDTEGPWRTAVPYPWGPRLDGLSLRAMRTHGWMELGFQEPFFRESLKRVGLSYDRFKSDTNGLVDTIVARRI